MPRRTEIYSFLGFIKKGEGFLPAGGLSPEAFYQVENLPAEWQDRVVEAVVRVLGDAKPCLSSEEGKIRDEKNNRDGY